MVLARSRRRLRLPRIRRRSEVRAPSRWVGVAGDAHQALPGERRRRRFRERVEFFGNLVAVDTCRRARSPCCAACASVMLRAAARTTRSSATMYCSGLPPSVLAAISCSLRWRRWPPHAPPACSRGSSGCRRRCRSTAGSCRCCPRYDLDLVPRDADASRPATRWHVDHRLGAEIADARLDVQAAVRLDHEQAVEAGRAGEERAGADAEAAHFGALGACRCALRSFHWNSVRAVVERLLDERARRR